MLNIINNIIKGFELNYKYFKSILSDDNNIYFSSDEITAEGYIIKQNTLKLINTKASICLCQIYKTYDDEYIPCLFVDELYNQLSKESQQFVIYHELGHFNLHKDIFLNAKGLVRNDKIEFEADEYAMNKVGKENAIKALRELQEIGLQLNFGLGKSRSYYKEIERRIENLK